MRSFNGAIWIHLLLAAYVAKDILKDEWWAMVLSKHERSSTPRHAKLHSGSLRRLQLGAG